MSESTESGSQIPAWLGWLSNCPPIIGVRGLAGSGKDSIADYLSGARGYKRVAFADALKDAAAAATGWPRGHFDNRDIKDEVWDYGLTPRDIAIDLGNLGRKWDPDFWVNRVLSQSRNGPIVVPDVRFPNEQARIKELGGVVWSVVRPGVVCSGDQSETALDGITSDATIFNDGDFQQLYSRVEAELARSVR